MLKCAGRFFTMTTKTAFTKQHATPSVLVDRLQTRGLVIEDITKAESYLQHIGYYRLSAYMYPLLQTPKEQHQYKPGSTFDKVTMFLNISLTLYHLKTI